MNAATALASSVEWTGAVLGIAGSLPMSFNRTSSSVAWSPWIASNVLLARREARAGGPAGGRPSA